MTRRLLFISKYPEIIREFTAAMDHRFDIDTALNGLDAASLLKKKEYQVVVTGLTMEGFNGEQIITYINKTFPDTVCIIYTTAISAAQLLFFMNKRDVFRVFLRPVNFRMEFSQALEEAFEYYANRVKDHEEEEKRKAKLETYKKKIADLEQKLERQRQLKARTGVYMKRITAFSVQEHAKKLNEENRNMLEEYEMLIVELCCGEGIHMDQRLTKAESVVKRIGEFIRPLQNTGK